MAESFSNAAGKGEIAHYQQFLLSHSVFRRPALQTRKNQGLFPNGLNVAKMMIYLFGKVQNIVEQDVFVKHECTRNGHFLRNVTFIFDLDLGR